MGKDGIASANPFGLLATKKLKGDPNKHQQLHQHHTQGPAATKTEEKKIVDTGPTKQSRVLTLAAAAPAAEESKEKEVTQSKAERELKDRHVDRSTKRDHTRKEGKGKGGWDDEKPEGDAEKVVAEGEEAEGEAGAGAQQDAVEEEKPTLTLAQFLEQQQKKKSQVPELKVRQIDASAFKNMTQMQKAATEESFLTVPKKVEEAKKPEAKKPEAKGKAGKKGAVEKVVEAPKKVDNHVKKRKEDKDAAKELELGFRLESRFGSGGRGRGEGRGRGRGRGAGRGRGGDAAEGTETTEAAPAAEGATATPTEGATAEGAAAEGTEAAAAPAQTEEKPAAEKRPHSPEGGRGRGYGGRGEGRGYRGRGEGRGFRGDREGGYRGRGEGRGGFRGGRGQQQPQQPNLADEQQFPSLGAK